MPRRYWSVLAAAIGCWALLALPGSSVAGIAEHARGGAAAVGPKAQPKAVQDRLRTLNLTWYYDYSPRLEDEAPGTHKVAVLRGGEKNRTPLDQVAAQARSRPGHYWIIFNEPDLEGQDAVSDEFLQGRGQQRFEYYAQLFHDYVATLKQADPTARVVAPNLFNWQGGYREWIEGFREAHRSFNDIRKCHSRYLAALPPGEARYGEEPPVDVWGLHLYSFDPDWQKLPVLDLAYARGLYSDFRDYVRSLPGHQSTPIWVTEMGTIWGYRDITLGPDALYRGTQYAWPEVRDYLSELIPWLEAEGVDRWFLFGTNPAPDPWASVPNALYLLDDQGRPTEAGRLLAEGFPAQSIRASLPLH